MSTEDTPAIAPPAPPDDPTQDQEIHTLRERISRLDTSLAAAEHANVELETRHANLSATLSHVQRELAQLSASSKFIAAAKEAVDTELAAEKRRREVAEETVEVLRGKVDDARKAFGTMQKQDKRASTSGVPGMENLALDALGFTDDTATTKPTDPPSVRTNTNKSSKRTSMLVGRRASNASDQDPASWLLSPPQVGSGSGSILTTPVLPQAPINAQGLRELRLATGGTSAWSAAGMPLSPGGGGGGGGAHETDPTPAAASSSSSNRWSGLGFGSAAAARSSPSKPTQRGGGEPENPIEVLDHSADLARPAASHRISSSSITSAHGPGPAVVDLTATPPPHDHPADASDRASTSLHAEITQLRSQLVESQEARAASEECLKALREFIASGGPSRAVGTGTDADDAAARAGIEGIKLPPLPTDRNPEDERAPPQTPPPPPPQKRTTSSGWGLGLWRSSPNPASVPAGPTTQGAGASTSTPGPSAASSPALGTVPVPNADEHGGST